MLKCYLSYEIVPSDCVRDGVVSPLPDQDTTVTIFLDLDIADLDLADDLVAKSLTIGSTKKQSRQQFKNNLILNTTQSGTAYKPRKLQQRELKQWYHGYNNTQLADAPWSSQKDDLIR